MSTLYSDRWIECTEDAIRIRCYYFPRGDKTIPYASIREVRRIRMNWLTGKGRVWGTGSFRYWTSLDPQRRRKQVALVLDTGARVLPFITPDDPAAVEAAILAHSAATATDGRVLFI